MNEKVEKYLKEKNCELQKFKNKKLIELGLSEKIYSDNDYISDEFPHLDRNLNKELDKPRAYKIVGCDVSDDEFKEIIRVVDEINYYKKIEEEKKANQVNINIETSTDENNIAKVLRFISVAIYIVGAIAGIYLGNLSFDFWTTALTVWISSFISGTVFLGFREVISLLQKILDINMKHKI